MSSSEISCANAYVKAVAVLCFAATVMIASSSHAATTKEATAQAQAKNAALDAALMECVKTIPRDIRGGPDRAAMDECMKKKGFSPPSGPPGGAKGAPPTSGNGAPATKK